METQVHSVRKCLCVIYDFVVLYHARGKRGKNRIYAPFKARKEGEIAVKNLYIRMFLYIIYMCAFIYGGSFLMVLRFQSTNNK